MKKYEHIVVECSIEEKGIEQILTLKDSPILESAKKVTLLHIYSKDMEGFLPTSLDKSNMDEVEKHVYSILEDIREKLKGNIETCEWSEVCILSNDPKIKAIEHLKSTSADLVISATKGNHGITYYNRSDSFSYYLIENSPCDIYVIRPN